MEKSTLNLIIVALIYFFINPSSAQDYEIRTVHRGGGLIAIEARYVGAGAEPTQDLDAFLDFTIDLRWPAGADLNMEDPVNTGGYGIAKASVETVDGSDEYQGYYLLTAPTFLPVTWTRETWIEIFTVQSSSDGTTGETVTVGELSSNPINPNIPNFNMSGMDFVPLVEGAAVLPVELISFDARKIDEASARISWSTASEINSSHFNLERSTDALTWTSIQKINAGGNSSEQLDYEYLDRDIPIVIRRSGTVYYRLQMIDLDGSYDYSPIRFIAFDKNRINLTIYPNPTVSMVYIDSEQEIWSIIIYNSIGEKVGDVKGREINMAKYTAGIYLLEIRTQYGEVLKTVVKAD